MNQEHQANILGKIAVHAWKRVCSHVTIRDHTHGIGVSSKTEKTLMFRYSGTPDRIPNGTRMQRERKRNVLPH